MRFQETALPGVLLVEPERRQDERGFFARTYSEDAFRERGVNAPIVQCSVSFNAAAGTLRGMHFQRAPYLEPKLVRCTMGAIYDVVIDVRPNSPTFRQWIAAELTAENRHMLYIPGECAHGFLTVAEKSEVFYQMFAPYQPEAGVGVRWNDPTFGVRWPSAPTVISSRDATYPDFSLDLLR